MLLSCGRVPPVTTRSVVERRKKIDWLQRWDRVCWYKPKQSNIPQDIHTYIYIYIYIMQPHISYSRTLSWDQIVI
jgi:hypothetical protein